jgi:hypothetical protein
LPWVAHILITEPIGHHHRHAGRQGFDAIFLYYYIITLLYINYSNF